jgi:dTDP-4-dehydrorhamnose 3,5-epimerase
VIVAPTALRDVLLVQPIVRTDARGFFVEMWHADRYAASGIPGPFVQDNHSCSIRHTLRGLHYQVDRPQGKLVQVVAGRVFDVAVDLRRSSPTFGHWVGAELREEQQHQLWIPPGFAHGFYVLSEHAHVTYKCTAPYVPELDRAVRWDDPRIGVAWPLGDGALPLLSTRDASAPLLAEAEVYP